MNPNLPGWLGVTPLHRFAREGDVEKAAIFIEHGANLHARDEELSATRRLDHFGGAGLPGCTGWLVRPGVG